MGDKSKLEQNQEEQPISLLSRSLITGFVGGVFWGIVGLFAYYFNFSEVAPKTYLLRSWLDAGWTDRWLGDVVSLIALGVISVIVAFIYYIIFKKINSIWMGVAYGALLWGIVFYVLQPIFPNVGPITGMGEYTIVSTICLFILYGTFVGYSISYDYEDTLAKNTQEDRKTQTTKA
ncbi:YqhR family membrane protein [Oceanobacillus halotolerans]|uniref:YqhR family membrane protein n=1 Tax=Oceanobacillus halotolerans TaxID=2663380 RepID=UPI0013DC178D|nr:YqhR family membrane protein [Oceanobacillus halotolerans]